MPGEVKSDRVRNFAVIFIDVDAYPKMAMADLRERWPHPIV